MSETAKPKKHTVMLDNRSRLLITGAEDVNGFNEEAVSIKTTAGLLIIKGSGLHIDKLSLETGEVSIDGKINSMQYIGSNDSRSRLGRLFR
ncbi:MAG TPA: sporulation protein YabP [Ruminococcaceae bacterium]|nr:sporulation protein YabP [Oscillospiraceae bacterium]